MQRPVPEQHERHRAGRDRRRPGQPVVALHRTRHDQRGRDHLAQRRHALLVARGCSSSRSRSSCTSRRAPGRFNVVPIIRPYEENIGNIGEGASGMLPPGNYVIATGKKLRRRAKKSQGMKVIHSPYGRVWLRRRAREVKSTADTANAVAIQAEEKLVPLNRWKKEGLNYTPPAPEKEVTKPTRISRCQAPRPGEEPLHLLDRPRRGDEAVQATGRRRARARTAQDRRHRPGQVPDQQRKARRRHPRRSAGGGHRRARAWSTNDFKELILAGFNTHNGWGVGTGRHLRHQLHAARGRRPERTGGAAAEHLDLPVRDHRTSRGAAQRCDHQVRRALRARATSRSRCTVVLVADDVLDDRLLRAPTRWNGSRSATARRSTTKKTVR